ncbi:MAG: DHH family phosphoesterase [Planctomycetes bacterium]|nr:DHH family phosphoesterase [Planctomycetota bacterium]
MKIVLLGRGHRITDIIDTFSTRGRQVVVVTSDGHTLSEIQDRRITRIVADPATVSFDSLRLTSNPDDIVVVAEHQESFLRQTLENLRRQKMSGTVVVYTPLPTRRLAADYPEFFFRGDRRSYYTELRELVRRSLTRQKVQAIRTILRESPDAVTVIWGNPDPDAIASAFALKELLAGETASWTICYLGEYTRPENLAMVRTLKIPTVKYAPELISRKAAVLTVDAQPSFFQLDGQLRFDVIIDHHPLAELGPHRFADVRPTYGSTSSILTEYYLHTGAIMSRRVATALFLGLKVDTANLTRNVTDADVNAFRHLRTRADENMLRVIELTQMPLSTLDHFSVAIANKKVARDVIFSYVGLVDNPDVCVHVAEFFIKLSGISWAITACRTREKVVVVFRSDGFRKHAGREAERLFVEYGPAGGHRTMARAELPVERLAGVLAEPTDPAIERWLLGRLAQRLRALGQVKA